MKQKKIGNKLYVFDLEPYVITNDTDATVVYVQNHVYDAFKALNPSLNIKRYNYNVIGVNKPEWYEYIDAAEENEGGNEDPINPNDPVNPDSPVINPDNPVDPDPAPTTLTTPTLYFNVQNQNISVTAGNYLILGYLDSLDIYNPENLPLTYSISSGNDYGYIDGNDIYTNILNDVGTYTIVLTAYYAGDGVQYNATSASIVYTIEVTESMPTFMSTTYSFESFSSADHSVKYGTGKVVTIENQPVTGYVAVQVTENTFDAYVDTPFVGRIFYISDTAQAGDEMYWNLYEFDNSTLEHTNIDVKVYYENQIPSEVTPSE